MRPSQFGYSSSEESESLQELIEEQENVKNTIVGQVSVVKGDPKLFEMRKRMHSAAAGDIDPFKATKAKKKQRKEKMGQPKAVNDQFTASETSLEKPGIKEEEVEDKTDPEIEATTHSNVSNLYIPLNKLHIDKPPSKYQMKFPMLMPGFKTYYTPKKLINTHTAEDGSKFSITSLHFHPKFGHVYLTASNSPTGVFKLWDALKPGRLIRDYCGLQTVLLNVCFNDDGSSIVSLSKDGWVKVWDTRSGEVEFEAQFFKATIVKFIPECNELMIGFENGHLEQVDYSKSPSEEDMVIQTYDNHHQGFITDIIFIKPWYLQTSETHDGLPALRFVTSGLDKIINVWILKINMPEKHISLKKSVRKMCIHPSSTHFICEEVGGGLITFTTGISDDSRDTSASAMSKKIHSSMKSFTNLEGDQILCTPLNQGPTFSPDGKTLVVGTSKGDVYFWDWKTTRVIRTINISKPISSLSVHPLETSMIAVGLENGDVGILD